MKFKFILVILFILGFLLLSNATLTGQVRVSGFRTQSSLGLPANIMGTDTVGIFGVDKWGNTKHVSTQQISLHNAWFGSSFNYQLTGDEGFDQNFLFNANVLYNIAFDSLSWNFPIVGNISLPFAAKNSSSPTISLDEIEIGVYPWKVISQNNNGIVLVLHGGIAYNVTPLENKELSPQELKLLIGLELSLPLGINGNDRSPLPITISIAPTYRSQNMDRKNLFGLSGAFIFPIAGGLGVLGDLWVPFQDGANPVFSAGVIVNGTIGK